MIEYTRFPKAMVIGHGTIGRHLVTSLEKRRWDVPYIVGSKNLMTPSGIIGNKEDYLKYLKQVDIAFLAIPTLDDGLAAKEYILSCTSEQKPIVTCEKGALSKYYSDLEAHLDRIGHRAAVGGGSGILPFALDQVSGNTTEIHAVLNGTLNYFVSSVASGLAPGAVFDSAVKLGYAEPMKNGSTILDGLNGEFIGDVPRKVSVLCNRLGMIHSNQTKYDLTKIQRMAKHNRLTPSNYKRLLREASSRRLIVSLTKDEPTEDDLCHYCTWIGNETQKWHLSVGFKDISDPKYHRIVQPGVFNSIMIVQGKDGIDGTNVLTGEGAGAGPTTNAMITDAEHLLKKHTRIVLEKRLD